MEVGKKNDFVFVEKEGPKEVRPVKAEESTLKIITNITSDPDGSVRFHYKEIAV